MGAPLLSMGRPWSSRANSENWPSGSPSAPASSSPFAPVLLLLLVEARGGGSTPPRRVEATADADETKGRPSPRVVGR